MSCNFKCENYKDGFCTLKGNDISYSDCQKCDSLENCIECERDSSDIDNLCNS